GQAGREGPVGINERIAGAQKKAAARERFARLLDLVRRRAERLGDRQNEELLATDAARAEELLLGLGESREHPLYGIAKPFRECEAELVDARVETPPAFDLRDQTARRQIVDDVRDQQRVAARRAVNSRAELPREHVPLEAPLEVERGLRLGERR